MIPLPMKKKPIDNFKFALGMGVNWVDLDNGVMYHIQEYAEKLKDPSIPKDKKPTKIRMTKMDGITEIGWADEYQVIEKMKDPEVDKRYAPETAKEHRRNW